MGKGDKKTRRGKIVNKTFGVRRKTKRNKGKNKKLRLADKNRLRSFIGMFFAVLIATYGEAFDVS